MSAAADAYSALIIEQLAEERSRKSSLEQRGISVITSSGALVTLLFGLAALTTKPQGYQVPDAATFSFILALVAFLSAAGLGIAVNSPRAYREAKVEALQRLLVTEYWAAEEAVGSMRSAELRVTVLGAARVQNRRKATLLSWAAVSQGVAVFFVAVGVAIILFAG